MTLRATAAIVVLLLASGCGDERERGPDIGTSMDATPPADSSSATDADAELDAGDTGDAGDATSATDTGTVFGPDSGMCPELFTTPCDAACPEGFSVGDVCDYGVQCCVCTATGFRCSNSQPECPESSSDACGFGGQACQFCEGAQLVSLICDRGTWADYPYGCAARSP